MDFKSIVSLDHFIARDRVQIWLEHAQHMCVLLEKSVNRSIEAIMSYAQTPVILEKLTTLGRTLRVLEQKRRETKER